MTFEKDLLKLGTQRLALVTGIEGFTGRYLAQGLRNRGYLVRGLAKHGVESEDLIVCDLEDLSSLVDKVAPICPSVVVHLAGISQVVHENVSEIYGANVVGTRNLFFALTQADRAPTAVIVPSSAHVYGSAHAEILDEDSPLAPQNDYAVSKVAMEYMARLWMEKLPITIARPFNYTGVGQSAAFLIPKIVDHYRRRASSITLGSLDVSRDFSDVRDIAECYCRLIECGARGEIINVCSGTTYSLRDVLKMCAELSGHDLTVLSNQALMREGEVKCLRGSNAKLKALIGSHPARTLRDTLAWMLDGPDRPSSIDHR